MKLQIPLLVIIALVAMTPVAYAGTEIGIGLKWWTTEVEAQEGEMKCVTYGLYNPFDTDVYGYIEPQGNLINITNYAEEYYKLEATKSEKDEKTKLYNNITIELRELRKNETKSSEDITRLETQLGTIDEEIRQLEEQIEAEEEELNKKMGVTTISIPAFTSSNNSKSYQVCFNAPNIHYDCLIDNPVLGKQLCQSCISKIYNGNVMARYVTEETETVGTGSRVRAGFSAPLEVKVRCKETASALDSVVAVAIAVVLVGVVVYLARRRKPIEEKESEE